MKNDQHFLAERDGQRIVYSAVTGHYLPERLYSLTSGWLSTLCLSDTELGALEKQRRSLAVGTSISGG